MMCIRCDAELADRRTVAGGLLLCEGCHVGGDGVAVLVDEREEEQEQQDWLGSWAKEPAVERLLTEVMGVGE